MTPSLEPRAPRMIGQMMPVAMRVEYFRRVMRWQPKSFFFPESDHVVYYKDVLKILVPHE